MIEFRSVGKTYPDGTVAVSDFSLTVPSHQTVALVGSSGSGKTTLLRMVNRMVDPTSGTVAIDGRDVSTINPVTLRRSIGYVLQAVGLLPHRTVLDNVATVPVLTGTPRRADPLEPGVYGRAVTCDLSLDLLPNGAIFDRLVFEGDADETDFFAVDIAETATDDQ